MQWTRVYATNVASASSNGGVSTLDNASAACSHFMIREGMDNPFHHILVKDARKALLRVASMSVDSNKKKAGARLEIPRRVHARNRFALTALVRVEAPSRLEACELAAKAVSHALALSSPKSNVFKALRWIELEVMTVVIRFLSCRCDTLRDIRIAQLDAPDDDRSPLGVSLRFFLDKAKHDVLGTKGGARMRAYPHLHNRYLCPVFATCLWLLLCEPYLQKAYDDSFATMVSGSGISAPCEANWGAIFVSPLRCTWQIQADKDATDDDISNRVLRSLHLFPNTNKKGELLFLESTTADTISSRLDKLLELCGYEDRNFSMHGIVRFACCGG